MSTKIKVRCPHCKGASFTLYERLETANGWRVSDGDVSPMFAPDGLPDTLGFAAACDCGHRWVPRRSSAMQIMDAGEDADPA